MTCSIHLGNGNLSFFGAWQISWELMRVKLERLPSLKLTASLHLKLDGWNTIVFFWGQRPFFRSKLLVVGSVPYNLTFTINWSDKNVGKNIPFRAYGSPLCLLLSQWPTWSSEQKHQTTHACCDPRPLFRCVFRYLGLGAWWSREWGGGTELDSKSFTGTGVVLGTS